MKKKLTVVTAIILLLAVSLTLFVGCDEIFKRNEERDNTQVVATVTYQGDFQRQTAYVYKYELAASFSSYASVYHTYYGMSYEEVADYVVRSLAQQKLLVLFAKDKVAGLKHLSAVPADIADLLSLAEKNKGIEDANESLLNSLKSIVEDDITEDKYNSGAVDTPEEEEDDDSDEELGSETVSVRFNSVGGSEVERQRVNKGSKVEEPDDPTRDGYTFYGWYRVEEDADHKPVKEGREYKYLEEFDFSKPLDESITLYAKWSKYVAPRTAMPKEEEEDEDADYDPEANEGITLAKHFYTDEYKATLYDELKEEDFVKDIIVPEDGSVSVEEKLRDYIKDGLSTLETNLKKNLYKKSFEECYAYYLNNQYESLLITRLERMLGVDAAATDSEINAEFDRVVKQNKETFAGSDTSYSSALTSSLDSTYYHPDMADGSYGFVINILLRLDDDSLKKLTDFYDENHQDNETVNTLYRNQLLSEMMVKISNPFYDAEQKVLDENEKEIELRDPMTDPKNPYNNVGKENGEYDHSYQHEVSEGNYENNYNKILTFKYNEEEEKFEIVFNVSEHPAMAYMLESWPAFDKDDKTGVIHQIYDSFEEVKAYMTSGDLTPVQGAYWLREVATKWAYLVGDDSGAVTSSSNNGGLGYLISPEGKDSSYLTDFTEYARALIKKGTGSYYDDSEGAIDAADFQGVGSDGQFKGDKRAFVVADSFLESGNTSNAYTGVFVLLNSYTVWDNDFYKSYATSSEGLNDADGLLPLDYIVTFAADEDDIKTLRDVIEEKFVEAKKADIYNFLVNEMGLTESDNISYNKKAYKSLWKDLE